jgi:hypothetical protein
VLKTVPIDDIEAVGHLHANFQRWMREAPPAEVAKKLPCILDQFKGRSIEDRISIVTTWQVGERERASAPATRRSGSGGSPMTQRGGSASGGSAPAWSTCSVTA